MGENKELYKLPPNEFTEDELEQHYVEEYEREMARIEAQQRRAKLNLPANLNALRRSLKLKQSAMAKIMGVSTRSYQMYETGERDIPSSALEELYVQLNVDLHKLFIGERKLRRQEKIEFLDFHLRILNLARKAFPDLTESEVIELTRHYIQSAEVGEIDNELLHQCYHDLEASD